MTVTRSGSVPWWPAERTPEPQDGREPLTRARIVDAALRIIDRDGLDALSMRRLGDELGAGTTSVYWHVANKDQLLDLVLDHVLGEVSAEVVDVGAEEDGRDRECSRDGEAAPRVQAKRSPTRCSEIAHSFAAPLSSSAHGA